MTTGFGQQILPLVRFQTMISTVCFVVSAANAIFYYMLLTTGTQREEAIAQYGIDIGRFMRNNLTNEQIYEIVFCSNGGYPEEVLESLLVHSTNTGNPRLRKKTHSLPMRMYSKDGADSTSVLFDTISELLKHTGPLLVCDFRMFPKYTDISITTFHGSWEFWKDPNATNDKYHAFLITGVKKTLDGSMGGVVFQVQDSLPGRPFVNIGIDLIKSMGVDDVAVIRPDVVYQGTSVENCFDNIPLSIISGSRWGVPSEITTDGTRMRDLDRLSLDDLGSASAVDDTDTAVGAENRSQNGIPDWSLGVDIAPGTDTTNMVFYT